MISRYRHAAPRREKVDCRRLALGEEDLARGETASAHSSLTRPRSTTIDALGIG
jgi:hypothetical protein